MFMGNGGKDILPTVYIVSSENSERNEVKSDVQKRKRKKMIGNEGNLYISERRNFSTNSIYDIKPRGLRTYSLCNSFSVRCNKNGNGTFGAFNKNFHEFLENTSLHGLKYTGDIKLSAFERIFFVIAFIVVFILSSYFISNIYKKWSEAPIIIGISPTPTFINNIPFPAVTICNLNQAKKSRTKHIQPGSPDFLILQSLCAQHFDINLTESDAQSSIARWKYFRKFLIDVSQPCSEMLVACEFGSENELCTDIFNPILSDEGLCCTFNNVHQKFILSNYSDADNFDLDESLHGPIPIDWIPEKGYAQNLPLYYYPRIARGTGSHMGLTIVLNASANEYYCSSTSSVGFKILLHSPAESPKIANYGFLMSTGTESRVMVTPGYATASSALRHISVKYRQCLFADEGNLTYFRSYSKKNCELECESRLLEQYCGCILFYMPRTSADSIICGIKDFSCTVQIQHDIELSNNNLSCDKCLPACFELSYSPQLSSTTFVRKDFRVRQPYLKKFSHDAISNNIAIVHIFYASNSFRSSIKEEFIGFTEFLSSTGGLLGLFMGFSCLSIVEILYFMSLRPYCAVKNHVENAKIQSSLPKLPNLIKTTAVKQSISQRIDEDNQRFENLSKGNYLKPLKLQRNRNEQRFFQYYE